MSGSALAESVRANYPFACLFRVRYSEIDGQQIVFNAHYLTWFDTALAELFRHLGIVYGEAREGRIRSTSIRFAISSTTMHRYVLTRSLRFAVDWGVWAGPV